MVFVFGCMIAHFPFYFESGSKFLLIINFVFGEFVRSISSDVIWFGFFPDRRSVNSNQGTMVLRRAGSEKSAPASVMRRASGRSSGATITTVTEEYRGSTDAAVSGFRGIFFEKVG